MSVNLVVRSGILLVMVTLLAGCSYTGAERLQCRVNPSSCMYDGPYEEGEKEYAEQKARELNRKSAQKIRSQ